MYFILFKALFAFHRPSPDMPHPPLLPRGIVDDICGVGLGKGGAGNDDAGDAGGTNSTPKNLKTPAAQLEIRAARALKKGDSVCIAYISQLLCPTNVRRQALLMNGFKCMCMRCTESDYATTKGRLYVVYTGIILLIKQRGRVINVTSMSHLCHVDESSMSRRRVVCVTSMSRLCTTARYYP